MAKKNDLKAPSREAKEEYIQSGGVHCPLCGSDQIEGGPFECEEGIASQEMRCLACDGHWDDVYILVNIYNPDWPDVPSSRKINRRATGQTAKKYIPVDLGNVDWKLLRRQKESLLRAISVVDVHIGKSCQQDLQGILHLLDHIQDQAAFQFGERPIFGPRKR